MINKYLYSLIYALSTSLSIIVIEKMGEMLPPMFALLVSTLLATIFFHVINFSSIPLIYQKLFRQPKSWIANCVAVAVIWVATFYGAKEAGAFVFLFIYFISSAIISYIVLMWSAGKMSYYQLVSAIGLIALLIVFVYNQSPYHHKWHYGYGILFAMVGGISSYIYRKLSYTMAHQCQLTASQILAIRSYGIILITAIAVPPASYALLNFHSIIYTAGTAILSFILPLYSNQRGIVHAGPEVHSIIAASCPLITCLLEFCVNHTWSFNFLISSIIGSFLLVFGTVKSYQSIAKHQ